MAALILLAAISVFIDFRTAGRFRELSDTESRWIRDAKRYEEENGRHPLEEVERLRFEVEMLESELELARAMIPDASDPPKEGLDMGSR